MNHASQTYIDCIAREGFAVTEGVVDPPTIDPLRPLLLHSSLPALEPNTAASSISNTPQTISRTVSSGSN